MGLHDAEKPREDAAAKRAAATTRARSRARTRERASRAIASAPRRGKNRRRTRGRSRARADLASRTRPRRDPRPRASAFSEKKRCDATCAETTRMGRARSRRARARDAIATRTVAMTRTPDRAASAATRASPRTPRDEDRSSSAFEKGTNATTPPAADRRASRRRAAGGRRDDAATPRAGSDGRTSARSSARRTLSGCSEACGVRRRVESARGVCRSRGMNSPERLPESASCQKKIIARKRATEVYLFVCKSVTRAAQAINLYADQSRNEQFNHCHLCAI